MLFKKTLLIDSIVMEHYSRSLWMKGKMDFKNLYSPNKINERRIRPEAARGPSQGSQEVPQNTGVSHSTTPTIGLPDPRERVSVTSNGEQIKHKEM